MTATITNVTKLDPYGVLVHVEQSPDESGGASQIWVRVRGRSGNGAIAIFTITGPFTVFLIDSDGERLPYLEHSGYSWATLRFSTADIDDIDLEFVGNGNEPANRATANWPTMDDNANPTGVFVVEGVSLRGTAVPNGYVVPPPALRLENGVGQITPYFTADRPPILGLEHFFALRWRPVLPGGTGVTDRQHETVPNGFANDLSSRAPQTLFAGSDGNITGMTLTYLSNSQVRLAVTRRGGFSVGAGKQLYLDIDDTAIGLASGNGPWTFRDTDDVWDAIRDIDAGRPLPLAVADAGSMESGYVASRDIAFAGAILLSTASTPTSPNASLHGDRAGRLFMLARQNNRVYAFDIANRAYEAARDVVAPSDSHLLHDVLTGDADRALIFGEVHYGRHTNPSRRTRLRGVSYAGQSISTYNLDPPNFVGRSYADSSVLYVGPRAVWYDEDTDNTWVLYNYRTASAPGGVLEVNSLRVFNSTGTLVETHTLDYDGQWSDISGDGVNLYFLVATNAADVRVVSVPISNPTADPVTMLDLSRGSAGWDDPIAFWAQGSDGFWFVDAGGRKLRFVATAPGTAWNSICCVATDHHTITQLVQDEQMIVEVKTLSVLGESDERYIQGFARAPQAPERPPAPTLANGADRVLSQWEPV